LNRLIEKPYLLFILSIPIILFSGFLIGDETININIYDTYYVIEYIHLTTLISILFGIIGLGYWIMKNKKLSKRLNLIHITLTFGGILLIGILKQFFRESIMEYEFNNKLTITIYLIASISIFGQVIYPINILYRLIKKNKTNS